MLLELKWGRKCDPCSALGLKVFKWQHLTGPSSQLGLGIKRIHLRYTPIEKHMNDVLGLAWKMLGYGPRTACRLSRGRK